MRLAALVIAILLGASGVAALPDLQVSVGVAGGASGGTPVVHDQPPASTLRNFGDRDIYSGPADPVAIYITNAGTETLILNPPDMGGIWWNSYLVSGSGAGSQLGPGQTTSLLVAFCPSSTGVKDAYLRIAHSDPTKPSPYNVPVTGVGVAGLPPAPAIELFADIVPVFDGTDFHYAATHTRNVASSLSFRIRNSGDDDLSILPLTVAHAVPSDSCIVQLSASPTLSIASGTDAHFLVNVTPLLAVWSFGMLISSNDPNRPSFTARFNGTSVVRGVELRMLEQPASTFTGGPLAARLVITDVTGEVAVTDSHSQVQVGITGGSGTPGATLAGTLTVTAVAGHLDFADLAIDLEGSGYSLTFVNTNGTLSSVASAPFDVTSKGSRGDDDSCSSGTSRGSGLLAVLLLCTLSLAMRHAFRPARPARQTADSASLN